MGRVLVREALALLALRCQAAAADAERIAKNCPAPVAEDLTATAEDLRASARRLTTFALFFDADEDMEAVP